MKKTMLIILLCLAVKATQADEYKRRRMFDAIEAFDCQKVKAIAKEGIFRPEEGAKFVAFARHIAKEIDSGVLCRRSKKDWLGLAAGAGLFGVSCGALRGIGMIDSNREDFPIRIFGPFWIAVGLGGGYLMGRALMYRETKRLSKLAVAANLKFLEEFFGQ